MYLKRMTTSLKCNPLFSKTFGYINKKYRQLDANGKDEIDDIIDVKLAKLQRKAEEGVESLG